MTGTSFDRELYDWLDDGPKAVADRVVDAALEEIHATTQHRPWALTWRQARVRMLPLVAAVALIGLGIVASSLLDLGGGIGTPLTTPGATATPTPTPTAATREFALAPAPGVVPHRVWLTAPDTWSTGSSYVIAKNDGEPPDGMAIAAWTVNNVYQEGCQWNGTEQDPPVGPTVDDLVEALTSRDDVTTTEPVDITVSGFAGKAFEMTLPDVDFATCDEGQFRSWLSPGGWVRYHQGPLEHSRVIVLDVEGRRILVFGRDFPGTSDADRAELDAILDGMRVTSGPPASAVPASPDPESPAPEPS